MKSFIEYIAPDDEEAPDIQGLTIPELMALHASAESDISESINDAMHCDDFEVFESILNMLRVQIFACREYKVALESKPLYQELKDEFDRFREKMTEE